MGEKAIVFGGTKSAKFQFEIHGGFEVDPKSGVIGDPSLLLCMAKYSWMGDVDLIFYFPERMLELIERSHDSKPHGEVLERLAIYFGSSLPMFSRGGIDMGMLLDNYSRLKKRGKIKRIEAEKFDEGVYSDSLKFFKDHSFYVEFSPKFNLLGDAMGKILAASKEMKRPVLMKSRRFSNLLREKITVAELPKQMDRVINVKRDICAPMFRHSGAQSLKLFVGFALGVGSIHSAAMSLAGIAFLFMDP